VLLSEEATGRDEATTSMRRRASRLPAGKTFHAWGPGVTAGLAAGMDNRPAEDWGRSHVPGQSTRLGWRGELRMISARVRAARAAIASSRMGALVTCSNWANTIGAAMPRYARA
jgi:hypothetical protein